MSIDRLQAEYPVSINLVQFPLHPETPPEGLTLETLFQGRDIEPMQARMRSLMAEAGLDYGERTHTYNSRLAQELAKWAETQPGGEAIHDRLFRAYFVEGVNLARTEALVAIAESIGLDPVAASRVLLQREFRDAVDADWRRSREAGITGVPTFTASGLMVVGCQPYEVLERFVRHLQTL